MEKKYWKSLNEKNQTEEFLKTAEREFSSSPFASEDGTDGVARRDFLKLMGASLALATTACVRRPTQFIVPYADQPPEITPGVPDYYASSWVHQGEAYGLIVKTREGRPIKLEGNPNFPLNKNGLSARAQAQTLSLYDPDRLQAPVKKNDDGSFSKATWDDIDAFVAGQLKNGANISILSSSLASPSTELMISDFFQAFKGQHYVVDTLGADDVIEGQKASYGSAVLPRFRFDKAKMIVSIDADFLGTWLSPTEFAKQFSTGRKPGPDMNRLVVFESMLSLTGSNADTRVQIAPSQQLTAVMGLIAEVLPQTRYAHDGSVAKVVSQFANAAQEIGVEKELFAQMAKDLVANKGQSLVVAGGIMTRTEQSRDLQIAVNFLNSILENDGKTVDGTSVPVTSYQGSYASAQKLISEMNKGNIDILVIHRLNAAYVLPESFGFAQALKKVKTVIYTGDRVDETGKLANFVAPDHHHLENWGDNETQKGVYAIQQPTIRPLYDTRSFELDLISWAYQVGKGPSRLKDVDSWYDYLHNNWKEMKSKAGVSGEFYDFWLNFLKMGVVDLSSRGGKRNSNATERKFLLSAFSNIQKIKTNSNVELVLYPKIGHADGSFANVAWLQEFPDPITRIVWDNYLDVSPEMANTLKLKEGQVVEVSVGNQKVKAPVHVQPGVHPKTVALAIGFGRSDAGSVGSNIGVNAYSLVQTTKDGSPIFSGLDVKINPTSEIYNMANVQEHNSMDGRQIVVQATLKDYLKNAGANIEREKISSLWPKYEYKGYRWAMVIDQSVCNGCGACVIACQSENNIPTVGKKYVLKNREMHWMRIDRYYAGGESNPEVVFQPMLCQQCENAPCETVCPVLATTHDDEGLNQMTYNRCVGTRYCSNNCPYKVRRFNWFNYSAPLKKPQTLTLNPDVTVRSRGVMEKCTFCVQRIHEAKNIAKDKGTTVKDGDAYTACQESCPTSAIIFGNINDAESLVSKETKNQRSYSVLEELNAVPMVQYQTRVKNTERLASESESKEGGAV